MRLLYFYTKYIKGISANFNYGSDYCSLPIELSKIL